MPLPVEDSIALLKAEIIAQDWRLSPKRVSQLDEAFQSLTEHFKGRKAPHTMLVMAANVLDYVKKRGTSPPDTIDFLKEAMAHVVIIHEELDDDPQREKETLQSLFARFTGLKEKIQQQSAAPKSPPPSPAGPAPAPQAVEIGSAEGSRADETATIHQLIEEFKNSLSLRGETGEAFIRLFEQWLDSPEVMATLRVTPSAETTVEQRTETSVDEDRFTACPPTAVRLLTVSGVPVAIQSSAIAMERAVNAAKASTYLQNGTVPLKDFSRLLFKLASLFEGSLALVNERTLKELRLPIIMPQGHQFAEAPPQEFGTVVVISNGNWHGALACDNMQSPVRHMQRFAKQQHGDIAGIAGLDDGSLLPLLDPLSMLRREGLLLMR